MASRGRRSRRSLAIALGDHTRVALDDMPPSHLPLELARELTATCIHSALYGTRIVDDRRGRAAAASSTIATPTARRARRRSSIAPSCSRDASARASSWSPGLIVGDDGRVLITQRRADQALPLQWEFPGGKVEPGEAPVAALVRELAEEIGVTRRGRPDLGRPVPRLSRRSTS